MAKDDIKSQPSSANGNGFRISLGPVVSAVEPQGPILELGELPRVYGEPLLFAIPRDPQTLFIYWSVDWSNLFSKGDPIDRQVYLRIHRKDGTTEAQLPVEPMLGSYYAPVSEPRSDYRVELGYYDAAGSWNSIAKSETATMPAEGASENQELDLATLPFHLSFQRLLDLFRASKGDALATILSRLQNRAVSEEERALITPEEWELLKAMDYSIGDLVESRKEAR